MRLEERDAAHVLDMLEAAKATVRFIGDLSLWEFLSDESEMARRAAERELEIIGEAARRISPAFSDAHPEIPWADTIGLRNVISHQYDRISHEEIYRIIRNRIPELIGLLTCLVAVASEEGN